MSSLVALVDGGNSQASEGLAGSQGPDPLNLSLVSVSPGRAWWIPELAAEELSSRLGNVAICRRDSEGTLRRVGPHDPNEAFTFVTELGAAVSGLTLLAEVTTFHTSGYALFFRPSANEVAAQIPPELFGKVAAFETLPIDDDVNVCWSSEHKMHQAVTRFYAAPRGINEVPVNERAIRERRIEAAKSFVAPAAAALDPRFALTKMCVIAHDGDKSACWKLVHHEGGVPWSPGRSGLIFQIGYHQDLPICATAVWDLVDNQTVLFISVTSRAVDYTCLESWIRRNLPHVSVLTAEDFLRHHERCLSVSTLENEIKILTSDQERDAAFGGVACFVEAGDAARIEIEQNMIMNSLIFRRSGVRLIATITGIDDESMNVEFEIVTIGSKKVAFYKPGRGAIDSEVLNGWLDSTFPRSPTAERANRADSQNFSVKDLE